jgi:hypothetical protein
MRSRQRTTNIRKHENRRRRRQQLLTPKQATKILSPHPRHDERNPITVHNRLIRHKNPRMPKRPHRPHQRAKLLNNLTNAGQFRPQDLDRPLRPVLLHPDKPDRARNPLRIRGKQLVVPAELPLRFAHVPIPAAS